ncbi:MAG: AMP-binding protein, partial [Oscillochloris sp.]|nr:AMP-binding protein [Oscillochloris sp.]
MTPYPPSILAAFLQHVATEPQRPCLIWQDEVIGYGQLATAAAAWAYHYAKLGVVRGDRVGLYLNNTPSFLAAYLGSHMLGAAAVLINTQYRQIELRHILSDSAPHVAVSDSESAPELQAALNHLHSSGIEIVQTSANSTTFGIDLSPANLCNMQLPYAGDLAILAYTSGTTGRSKGAMLTHGNLVANSTAVIRAWHWTQHDRLLIALPLFHIHGLGVGVHGTLLSGASMELHPHFEPHTILSSIATGTISMFFGVPTTYSRLLQAARGQEVGGDAHAAPPTSCRLPPTMRRFVSGSVAMTDPSWMRGAETRSPRWVRQILAEQGGGAV